MGLMSYFSQPDILSLQSCSGCWMDGWEQMQEVVDEGVSGSERR